MKYPIVQIGKDTDHYLDGTSFVGVSRINNSENLSIVVPYGVELPEEISDSDVTQKDHYSFLRRYVKSIQKAISCYTKEKLEDDIAGIHNPVAAVNLLYDYLTKGKFIEFRAISDLSKKGKIDFQQTIKRVQPLVVGDRCFFDKYISRKRIALEESFIADVQGNIINHFMDHGGVILFGQSISIPVRLINFSNSSTVELTITKLRKELTNTFNSRKENIIRWSISYLEGLRHLNDKDKDSGTWKYAIIASTLWEIMVDSVFSNQTERNKTKYGKTYEFTYLDGRAPKKGKPTQHDTIYEDDEMVIIIDAKMYGSPLDLLSEKVLGKQFGYYEQAKLVKEQEHEKKIIINILILPFFRDFDRKYFQNRIVLDPHTSAKEDPYKIIYLYEYPANDLVDDYYYGRKKYNYLIDQFKRFIQERDVAFFLERRGCNYHFNEMPLVQFEDIWDELSENGPTI